MISQSRVLEIVAGKDRPECMDRCVQHAEIGPVKEYNCLHNYTAVLKAYTNYGYRLWSVAFDRMYNNPEIRYVSMHKHNVEMSSKWNITDSRYMPLMEAVIFRWQIRTRTLKDKTRLSEQETFSEMAMSGSNQEHLTPNISRTANFMIPPNV